MTNKYQKLLTPLKFKNGGSIKYRTALSPMVTGVTESDGSIGSRALDFYGKRSDVAGLLITGASNVNQAGRSYSKQIDISDDKFLPGLKKLTQVMKKDGNKPIVQLYHGGRMAIVAQNKYGKTLGPSVVGYPDIDYRPKEMTESEIEQTIADFGSATKRAISAGFSGVEIHGANFYLLQQFFSPYSNRRDDQWGGSPENRMKFPLAIVKAVKKAAEGTPNFIIGYRVSPFEVIGKKVTYKAHDVLPLINQIVNLGVDYIHTSLFSKYNTPPKETKGTYGELVENTVGNRAKTIIVGSIHSADDALDALNYGDIAAIGREALIEPEFTKKIAEGQAGNIKSSVTKKAITNLHLGSGIDKLLFASLGTN